MVPVSLISNGLVCSAQVVMFQVYSAWQRQCFLVGCYLTKVSISSIKYPGFKMSGSHRVWAGFFAGPILQKSENICFQLVCREQIFPLFLILLADLLKHFKGAIVWLPPSFCHYRSSLLGFALFHPMISGFYLPFCMNVLFLWIYWKAFLSCSLKSSGGVGLGLDWTQSTFQLPVS